MTTPFVLDDSGPRYMGSTRELAGADVALLGVPYDGTTSFRPGARSGPDALRQVSSGLESYSPERDLDLDDLTLADLGNLEIGHGAPRPVLEALTAGVRHILDAGALPLVLGGEHSITPGAVRAVAERYPDLAIVQLDAHADLRADYLGERDNHACAMRRCLDVVGSERMLQVGIRSGTREEFQELRSTGRLVAPRADALREALERIEGPIYLTVDLDVFDPALLPGTGTPEAGGIDWPTFAALLDVLSSRQIVAADVVELAPQLDPTGCSSVLAAKVVREIALVACASRRA